MDDIVVYIWHCDKELASMTSPDETQVCLTKQEATLAIAEAKGNGYHASRNFEG
jgi:hypothetical protein